ncbi:MAG: hypothetical protein ROO71_08995 [Balneola sp.]
MKNKTHIFFTLVIMVFAIGFANAQPTPADASKVVSDAASLEYIEYSGTVQFNDDSTGIRYSKPFSINRFASGPAFLSLVTSNPQDGNGIDVLVDLLVTPDLSGVTGYTTIDDTLTITASETNYLTIGAANEPLYNMSYWALVKVTGLSTDNRDSTAIAWRLRGYRPVASTRNGQVKN